ncbi:hypothetical protein [Bradyrhizobium sp. HKCCYLRH3061]|uniref:hypothetical protein n=1 Tax=Bradyrhizobium sp. HKCCYLRH3061 TaxID=3420734 RepID=UPI003EBA8BBF
MHKLVGVVVIVLVACISVASFSLNIALAKRRVSVWRRGSTNMFIRSNGMGGIQRRAKEIWMSRLGYEWSQAVIIAKHQQLAGLIGFVGCGLLFGVAAAVLQYLDSN